MYEVMIKKPLEEDLTNKGFNKNIKINKNRTAESLMKYGFTNHHSSSLSFYKDLGNDIGFTMTVNKEMMQIENIDVLDEEFAQPYDYQAMLLRDKNHEFAKEIYYKVNDILASLQKDGVITGFEIGMYV